MESITVIDDTETTIDRWKDWRITNYELSELPQTFQELNEGKAVFTKDDFKEALEKVCKVKK